MRRARLPLFSALCLFFAGATLALWVRSYRNIDFVIWRSSSNESCIKSAYGRLIFHSLRGFPESERGVKTSPAVDRNWTAYASYYWSPAMAHNTLGFAWAKTESLGMLNGHDVYFRLGTIPDWFVFGIFLAMPIFIAIKHARRKPSVPERA
ncbi:MAG TPA: hypothetical protein VFE47_18610 [Tepidisphaeraceae bacterium]|nr:hypothetical protein [Tepidisphaeraceae bacterium]